MELGSPATLSNSQVCHQGNSVYVCQKMIHTLVHIKLFPALLASGRGLSQNNLGNLSLSGHEFSAQVCVSGFFMGSDDCLAQVQSNQPLAFHPNLQQHRYSASHVMSCLSSFIYQMEGYACMMPKGLSSSDIVSFPIPFHSFPFLQRSDSQRLQRIKMKVFKSRHNFSIAHCLGY